MDRILAAPAVRHELLEQDLLALEDPEAGLGRGLGVIDDRERTVG